MRKQTKMKIITTIIIALMLVMAMAGCMPTQTVTLPSEQPAKQAIAPTPEKKTSTSEPAPDLNLEITPEPKQTSESTDEKFDFPIITENIQSYEELVALLDKPDKEETGDLEDGTRILFYNKYNRVFSVAKWGDNFHIEDETPAYETVNKIGLWMNEKEVTNKLGKPDLKSNPEGSSTGEGSSDFYWIQTWTYKDLGIEIDMGSTKKDMSNANAEEITVNKNSKLKLSCGIGIGSTKNEVIKALCIGMYPEDYIDDGGISLSGSCQRFLDFKMENDKVTEIRFWAIGD